MPSVKSRIRTPHFSPVGDPQPIRSPVQPVPQPLPAHLATSAVMISSLPSIATTLDGATRQFYRGNLPTRRTSLPG